MFDADERKLFKKRIYVEQSSSQKKKNQKTSIKIKTTRIKID